MAKKRSRSDNETVEPPKKKSTKEQPDFCKNPLCDHKTFEQNAGLIEKVNIVKICSLDDLIKLGKSFHCKKNLEYNGLNLRLLCNIIPALCELNGMIGMNAIKNQIIDHILFFIQGFNAGTKCNQCIDCAYNLPCPLNREEMLHTAITGPPGVGKTHFAKILGKIYTGLGVLKKGHFCEIKRSDLVAKFLGQTSHRTQEAIDKCIDGIMFIDEAYSLGNSGREDAYSKECIDTLTRNLSERRDFLCIIAGYEDALEKCFFNVNEGLRRRFTFRYHIEGYSHEELLTIFEHKIYLAAWKLEYKEQNNAKKKDVIKDLFRCNMKKLPNFGGDVETLFLQCKITHSRKIPKVCDRFLLTNADIEEGFQIFVKNREHSGQDKGPPPGMYI